MLEHLQAALVLTLKVMVIVACLFGLITCLYYFFSVIAIVA